MTKLNLSTHFKVLHVQGEKASEFLQSQFTNDVKQSNNEQLQWQAYCDRQGFVQSIFGLWGADSNYYLLIAADLSFNTAELLKKYAIFSKVNLAFLSLVEISLELLPPHEKNIQWLVKNFDQHRLELTWHSNYCKQENDFTTLRQTFMDHHFPWLCSATSNCFRPHEINLPELAIVNFKKGCFPGQEIIARMHYRGKPKQGFYVFYVNKDQNFLPGQILYKNEKQIGQFVDVVNLKNRNVVSMVLDHDLSQTIFV